MIDPIKAKKIQHVRNMSLWDDLIVASDNKHNQEEMQRKLDAKRKQKELNDFYTE